MLGHWSQPVNLIKIATTFSTPLHIHQHEVRMDSEPTLQLVQCIQYPLQPQVCIGKITTKDHTHPTSAWLGIRHISQITHDQN